MQKIGKTTVGVNCMCIGVYLPTSASLFRIYL